MVSGDELTQLRTSCGSTMLHIAAEVDNKVAADIVYCRMPRLPYIQNYNADFSVHTDAKNEHAAILLLLIGITMEKQPYQNKGGLRLISDTTNTQFFSSASSLVEMNPYLATLHDLTIGSAYQQLREMSPLFPTIQHRTSFPEASFTVISGAALKIQREIQWYQLVEKLVARSSKIQMNNEGKTPKLVFTEEHKNLEGGNDSHNGLPIFHRRRMFFVFAMFLFLSLSAFTYALISFLAILISRYSEQEFLHIFSKRLFIGLFISVVLMTVTCTATVCLVFDHLKWVLITMGVCNTLLLSLFLRILFRDLSST
ncbi:hypothetical protein MIMGU_mgv11b023638mg [Erythranthe guttata]|uniref:PGG domain-containing protein n=1 Tax=Erythranthe guttata TaxID=4155 RepID=A0A022QTB2_ERYGU|nr:hypothetical protein MIMGU_mgv11b023638mg [Erythranthe guttata]